MMFTRHKTTSFFFCGLLSVLLFVLAQPQHSSCQALSSSLLSAHLINSYTVGSSNIVAGHPRVLKVLALDSGFPTGMLQAMRDYKATSPGGKIVVRVYTPRTYTLANDATASAGDFWTNVLQQSLNSIAVADRSLIDYLEGPNEGDTPTLGYPWSAPLQASQWFNQFWTNLTPRIVAAGYKPCIGSIAVGNPGGSTSEVQSYLAAFVPALRQAQNAGGAWSYHAYTINYTTDIADEIYYSLRYRQFYSYFAASFPDLVNMPLILTEGGVDASGDPATSGWQARGTPGDFERWLNWFDQQMRQDVYVLGCTLFENGDPGGWSSFDLEPIGAWFKSYLSPVAAIPAAPSGVSASAGNASVTLSWTNSPVSPTSWNIKRSTNNAGPFFVVASNIATGVRGTSFTDNTVSNFTQYYYVVTAMNAVGESGNSSVVSATPVAVIPTAINCGGPGVGGFVADNYFDTGTEYTTATAINTNGLVSPAPMTAYQSQRYGNLTYTLPYLQPNSSYKVRFHFAEVYWGSTGQRVFHVLVNGGVALSNFDIFAAAGGNYKGVIREAYGATDSQGRLFIQLTTVLDNAAINAIETVLFSPVSLPGAPTNLAAAVGNAVVNLSWSAPPGAAGFMVKRATVSGGPYSVIATNTSDSSYTDPNFTPNTTYYYVVSATNGFGESGNSAQVSATPTNGLPDVVVTSVTWTPATVYNGGHVVFLARVLNRGSASTPGGTTVGVGFNVDGTTVAWSSSFSSALAPNASVLLTANGGPAGINYWIDTPGSHTITANADDINRFPESIESNNSMTVALKAFATGYALNSGGGTNGSFAADANYAGSANTFSVTNAIDLSSASNAAPAGVYQSERWGGFSYVLNNLVPGSNYLVRLHFAEISPSVNNPGDRTFNVFVNGVLALSQYDILAQAGAKFRAISRDVKKRADNSGLLTVDFTPGNANQPKLSGIELLSNPVPFSAPIITNLVVAGTNAVITWQSSRGTLYQAQYKDDLSQTGWTGIGTNLAAEGLATTVTNAISPLGRRYFRVMRID
jgi:hypothetical protein